MIKLGFCQAKYNASLYYNPTTGVKAMVHGDDFVAVGDREDIAIFMGPDRPAIHGKR